MKSFELMQRIDEIERKIAALPHGTIVLKTENGEDRYYHRITRGMRVSETALTSNQAKELSVQIEKRKTLENELRKLNHLVSKTLFAMYQFADNCEYSYLF